MNKKKIIAGLVSAVTAFSALGVISANANATKFKKFVKPYFGDVIRYDLTMDQVRIVYKGHRPSETYRRGDVNGDGQLNVTDIVKISAAIREKTTLNPKELCRADVNGDKYINEADFFILSDKITGVSNFNEPYWHSINTADVKLAIFE
ncbi:dockerin type I repeat-containing protein [Ruminococcus albus]|uniref:Dockerin domain-containing protein n=1 Tax=Ruminococcus albus TaxID=1264 RepID=A0A1H7NG68_RUMAL|nr:dockerin type I repeat-containing protein [Ruminococcus albus]SEL22321.1 hypothetical protein SAMN05216469_11525 [Ruminococcus albus]